MVAGSRCHARSRAVCPRHSVGLAERRAGGRAVQTGASTLMNRRMKCGKERSALSVIFDSVQKFILGTAAAVGLQLTSIDVAQATSLRLPIAAREDVATVQETLLQTWRVVDDIFYDEAALNRLDWDGELHRAMWRAASSESPDAVYLEISSMLNKLNDPYTRLVPPNSYEDLRLASDGEVQGVGLMLASDPNSKQLVVLAPLRNSPAAKAGIRRGDVVVSINGVSSDALDTQAAGRLLRGASGTNVSLQFVTPADATPGVPARPISVVQNRGALSQGTVTRSVTLRRESVPLASVFASKFNIQGQALGYLRLLTFSATSPQEMAEAVESLTAQGVRGFVLDLRDNGGGLVNASMSIAHLWLKGHSTMFNVTGRDHELLQTVVLGPGAAATELPLTVLVNGRSASASEILASALHDNGRARVVGTGATFGKGRIQTVYEMNDGSALFVTIAQYQTPKHADIDHVGVSPDIKCQIPREDEFENAFTPITAATVEGQTLVEELFSDPCFIAAGKLVANQAAKPHMQPQIPPLPPFLRTVSLS